MIYFVSQNTGLEELSQANNFTLLFMLSGLLNSSLEFKCILIDELS